MGYRFQNICYETKQEFLNVFAQNCQGSGGSGGLGSYYAKCSANTDTITIQGYGLSNGTAYTPFEITPQLIECSANFTDAVDLGWKLALILVAAFAARVLIKVLG